MKKSIKSKAQLTEKLKQKMFVLKIDKKFYLISAEYHKNTFFFWEFVRIGLKISVILLSIIFESNNFLKISLPSLLIMSYSLLVSHY